MATHYRTIAAIALAVGLMGSGPVASQVDGVRLDGEGRIIQRHNFGMDWDGKPGAAVDLRFPARVLDCIDRWTEMPDRVERAASWGTFATGAMAGVMVMVMVGAVTYIARKRE